MIMRQWAPGQRHVKNPTTYLALETQIQRYLFLVIRHLFVDVLHYFLDFCLFFLSLFVSLGVFNPFIWGICLCSYCVSLYDCLVSLLGHFVSLYDPLGFLRVILYLFVCFFFSLFMILQQDILAVTEALFVLCRPV